MKKPDLENATKQQLIDFINYQEKAMNGANELQIALGFTMFAIAQDVRLINEGKKTGLKILSADKDDKIFANLMTVIKFKNDFNSLSLLPKSEQDKVVTHPIEDRTKKYRAKTGA